MVVDGGRGKDALHFSVCVEMEKKTVEELRARKVQPHMSNVCMKNKKSEGKLG